MNVVACRATEWPPHVVCNMRGEVADKVSLECIDSKVDRDFDVELLKSGQSHFAEKVSVSG